MRIKESFKKLFTLPLYFKNQVTSFKVFQLLRKKILPLSFISLNEGRES